MGKKNTKLIIGIMGGIGSGKSTVADILSKLGCGVIDADAIGHEMLKKSEVIRQLKEVFGGGIFAQDGQIDKAALAQKAFGTIEAATKLNSIIHPLVLRRIEELISEFNELDHIKAIVLDVPLLAETGWEKRCDKLIFVACDRQKRIERAEKPENFEKILLKRENFQISLDKKAEIAHYIVQNNSGFSVLTTQLKGIFSCLTDNR